MNLFHISPNDASMVYLSRIFGNVSGVIAIDGKALGGPINILSTMFKVFNGVVLTIAVLMLIYITVVGVIGTAQEGEFMGKKWNNIWIPIRAVLGFALLVPTGAGYCGLQILMMWVIVQGVGAADVLWNTALSYINLVGTYPQIQVPSIGPQAVLPSLFQGLVCDASTRFNGNDPNNQTDPKSRGPGSYYCMSHGGCSDQPVTLNTNSNKLVLGASGECGTLVYCDPKTACAGTNANSLQCLSCTNQITALQSIVQTLSGIAHEMVKADYSYRMFYANSYKGQNAGDWGWIYQFCQNALGVSTASCCVMNKNQAALAMLSGQQSGCSANLPPPNKEGPNNTAILQTASNRAVSQVYWPFWPGLGPNLGMNTPFIQTAVDYYMDLAQGAVTTYIAAQGQDQNKLGPMKEMSEKGWVLAGAFYYQLANETGKDFKQSLANFSWQGPSRSSSIMTNYRNNVSAAQSLIKASQAGADTSGGTSGGRQGRMKMKRIRMFEGLASQDELSDLASLDDVLTEGFGNVGTNMETSTTGGGTNPLRQLVVMGQALLGIADAIFFAILIVLGIAAIAGNLSVFVLGTGFMNPVGPGFELIMMFVIPMIYGLLALLVSGGALLGVYVPLIPFVIFAFGVISWLISAVETMVAGPLVALGIISPSGQHEMLGKAEPALMLLFNVFLRPSLMIFGLIAAMLLATVVVDMINAGFSIVFHSGSVAQDPIGLIVLLCAYIMLLVAALNKCFAVINVLPQQVMRWISGQGEQVEAPLQEIKGGTEAGAMGVRGGAAGTQESAAAVGRPAAEQAREKRAAATEAAKGGAAKGGKGKSA